MAFCQQAAGSKQEGIGREGLTFASSVVSDAAASGGAALGATSFARQARTCAMDRRFTASTAPWH